MPTIDYKGRTDKRTGREHIAPRIICGTTPGQEVVLRPGANKVVEDDFAWLKETAAFLALRSSGMLVVLEGEKGKSFDLSKADVWTARDVAKRCIDPDALALFVQQVEASPELRGANARDWSEVLDQLRKNLLEVTTDANGHPVAPRKLQLRPEVSV